MKLLPSSCIIIGIILMAGCKKYLSEEPAKQSSVQTVSQLDALVDNASAFVDERNSSASFSTDDQELPKTMIQNYPSKANAEVANYYTFQTQGLTMAPVDNFWTNEFKKIFTANLILENIDKVTGDDATRARVRADAYFIRANSNWVLANNYCAPYTAANFGSLGLPLKKTTDFGESGKRATLKETYDFILSDIAEALKTAPDDVDARATWRISKKAISAFMSRFYLFTGDNDKSIEEANKALASATRTLVDFNTLLPGNSRTFGNPSATLTYAELNDWQPVKYYYWTESYYARYLYNPNNLFVPSAALLASYDQPNDLRYKKLMIPNGQRAFGVINPSMFAYTLFSSSSRLLSGPTVAEVLLNKAEASARKGDFAGAMTAVNALRVKRMNPYIALTAADKDDAIKKVLQERRREMPFAMRWYDIRRFSVNDYPADDITVTRDFFNVSITGIVDVTTPKTYTLNSKRYLVPINNIELSVSSGDLEQNPY